jgi:uncharacterized protein
MKRVLILHKWGGTPADDWYPWLKNELEKKGIVVKVPEMPDTRDPKMDEWVPKLSAEIGKPDEDTYLVGHSMGAQAILRYLEGLKPGEKVGGALFVAGFITVKENSVAPESMHIFERLSKSRIDLEKVRVHCNKFISIFSDNDEYVGLENAKVFEQNLGSKIVVIPGAGHLTKKNGYKELHAALNELLKMMK